MDAIGGPQLLPFSHLHGMGPTAKLIRIGQAQHVTAFGRQSAVLVVIITGGATVTLANDNDIWMACCREREHNNPRKKWGVGMWHIRT